jgi:hypothetical protein
MALPNPASCLTSMIVIASVTGAGASFRVTLGAAVVDLAAEGVTFNGAAFLFFFIQQVNFDNVRQLPHFNENIDYIKPAVLQEEYLTRIISEYYGTVRDHAFLTGDPYEWPISSCIADKPKQIGHAIACSLGGSGGLLVAERPPLPSLAGFQGISYGTNATPNAP